MSHDCPTPRVDDPNSSTLPQSSIGFRLIDGKLIELCDDCGAKTETSDEHAMAYYRANEILFEDALEEERTQDDTRLPRRTQEMRITR